MYIFVCILIFLAIFWYINYKIVFVSKYNISNSKIPKSFDGYKILHISDWHCTKYGKNNKRLINLILKQDVDIIVITGDMVLRKEHDYTEALEFISKINSKKIYFVTGNHELSLKDKKLKEFKDKLENIGVSVIDNSKEEIIKNGEKINIYGLEYCSKNSESRQDMKTDKILEMYKEKYTKKLGKIDPNMFNILLVHDPLYFNVYEKMKFDLVYAGHLHGGGIRLFGFGLATPRKHWTITHLAAGLKKKNNTFMIVSRGAGNSTIPVRIFDPPEISITTLHVKK